MVEVGDPAPDFVAPLANGDVSKFAFADAFPEEAPVVLAFFPGSFTSVCSHEMTTFQERLAEFEDHGATLYGVSVDLPFSQNEFRDELGLGFDLISDAERTLIDAYDVSMDFGHIGLQGVAKRAVFVIDEDMTVTYAWVSDDPGVEPDYDEVLEAVADAA
jgi:peroxiredoxin